MSLSKLSKIAVVTCDENELYTCMTFQNCQMTGLIKKSWRSFYFFIAFFFFCLLFFPFNLCETKTHCLINKGSSFDFFPLWIVAKHTLAGQKEWKAKRHYSIRNLRKVFVHSKNINYATIGWPMRMWYEMILFWLTNQMLLDTIILFYKNGHQVWVTRERRITLSNYRQ